MPGSVVGELSDGFILAQRGDYDGGQHKNLFFTADLSPILAGVVRKLHWQNCQCHDLRSLNRGVRAVQQAQELGAVKYPFAQTAILEIGDSMGTPPNIRFLQKRMPMTHNDLSTQEILNALHSHVAVLDKDGNITHVNEAWVRFSEQRGALPSSTGVGVNYFAVCRARGATPEVEEILAGIRAVIDEAIPQFRAEYMCNTPEQTYWFEVTTKPLPKPHRSAVVYHTDITELKKARDEYAVILNGARGILWRAKLPGFQTIFTSKHVEAILGYPVQAWTTQPDLWINRIHPEDRERVLAFTAQATEEGRHHDFEYRMISADGQTVWLRNIVNVVVENGRPREVVGISVDITERKLAEERLRESEERFRTLAEAIPQLCWMARGDGHIFWYNQRWYTYTGTTPEQMEGWGWQSVHDPQALPLVLERWKASIATGEPFDMVFPLKAANGVFHPFLTRITPVKDSKGSVVGWFGTNTDVTELRDTQEALRKSEEKFRRVVEHIADALFVDNVEGQIVFANERFLNLFGYSREELPDIKLEDYVAPEYRATLRDRHDRRVRGEAVPTHFEYEGFRRDGKRMWLEVDVVPITDENGNLIGTQSALRDITERKKAEEALSGMSRKLIESQEQERARIGRELHDDINQRLAMLAVELEQLKENPSEVESRAEELQRQTREISNDVQALSHDLHSSQLEYLGAVAGMKSWCKEFSERQRMEIDFKSEVSSTLPFEVGLSLFRVIQEALHNAQKHSGVKRIEVQLAEHSNEVHLIVRDSGKGFDIEVAHRGRGLGLTSMQERVRLVNGTISIESKPMGGTTIHVRVPLASKHEADRATG